MAMKHAVLVAAVVAALPFALASCRSPDAERVGTLVQSTCNNCVDPEGTVDQSYVSIGVMPAAYPIDWGSPNKVYGTTIATTVIAKTALKDKGPVHDIGHVLLKVRCGRNNPVYISQTGALVDPKDPDKQLRQLQSARVNMLFATFDDGKLYEREEAEKDWDDSAAEQVKLGEAGTYESNPAALALFLVRALPDILNNDEKQKIAAFIGALPKVQRHRFVRATIRLDETQCNAILDWRKAYEDNRGSKRYAIHRAPWVTDADRNYDGGACGSVSFAGAFYASGLDYKKVAPRVVERLEIGTARLTEPVTRDNRKLDLWYSLQDEKRYTPGQIPCAKEGQDCKAKSKKWFDALYDKWNGPEDVADNFSKAWGTGKDVKSATLPLVAFEPERFYQEILKRWNQPNHDAFAHPGWCKTDSKVPAIVIDLSKKDAGRKQGLKDGFANIEVKLF